MDFFFSSPAFRFGQMVGVVIGVVIWFLIKREFFSGKRLPPPPPPTGDLETDLRPLLEAGFKIDAIKLVRERTGCGLKEAKEQVEEFERRWFEKA